MLPIIMTKPSHALIIGCGKAAAYKFKTLHEADVPTACLSLDFQALPKHAIQTIKGDFYSVEDTLFTPFDLIYLAIPYPEDMEMERHYQIRVKNLIAQGKLVNACAKPDLGNFIHPATRRVENLIVSISTSGKSPKQAVQIAERFKKELEHEFQS